MDFTHFKRMMRDFTAGAVGGTACVLAGQPFDTIKVKMQTFPSLFRNALDCGIKTVKQERFRGLYAGTVPSLVSNIAENSFLFLFYGQCLSLIKSLTGKKTESDLTIFHKACAGSGAAFFMSVVLNPAELVKCRLQAQHQTNLLAGKTGAKSGVVDVTMQIIRNDGFQGMFRGLTSTWAREVPGYFFFFGGYEFSRYMLTPAGGDVSDVVKSPIKMILCGGFAGTCLWTAIFPADVVKSRIQVLSTGKGKAPGFVETLVLVFRTEGLRALYKGLGPSIVRCFPANGALFMAFEATQTFLKKSDDAIEL